MEVLHNKQWGTVCDRQFDYPSANVLCRSLGYGTARTITRRAGYGRGVGRVWISHLNCTGTEDFLHKCKKFKWGGSSSQCNKHAGDVGVECHVPDIYSSQRDLVSKMHWS